MNDLDLAIEDARWGLIFAGEDLQKAVKREAAYRRDYEELLLAKKTVCQ